MWRAHRVARLRHPNLVPMLPLPGGAGLVPIVGEERRVADFTRSGTFRRFELERVVRLLLDVLQALSVLHDDREDGLGFVHGGVSPQTIYLAENGTARLVPLMSWHMSPAGRLMSTGYVAPELLLGEPADASADTYSVGVMLWEALAAEPLFPDHSRQAVLTRLGDGSIRSLVGRPGKRWATGLQQIAERAIARAPAERYGSASELWAAIAVAVAPHFASHPRVNWQDEAPTLLVPMSNSPLRSITPLASVLEIEEPAAAPSSKEPLTWQSTASERAPRRRHGFARWLIGGAGALGALIAFSVRFADAPVGHAAAPSRAAAEASPVPAVVATERAATEPQAAVSTPLPSSLVSASPAASTARRLKRRALPKAEREHDYGF